MEKVPSIYDFLSEIILNGGSTPDFESNMDIESKHPVKKENVAPTKDQMRKKYQRGTFVIKWNPGGTVAEDSHLNSNISELK